MLMYYKHCKPMGSCISAISLHVISQIDHSNRLGNSINANTAHVIPFEPVNVSKDMFYTCPDP